MYYGHNYIGDVNNAGLPRGDLAACRPPPTFATKEQVTDFSHDLEGFVQPAEWTPHSACWLAWPSDRSLWLEHLKPAQGEVRALAAAIADCDPTRVEGSPRGERLEVLVPDAGNEALARTAFAGLGARLHRVPFGDIWLRDIAPVFMTGPNGRVQAACFGFNGWGGKYVLPHDDQVASRIAALTGLSTHRLAPVLEGGSVEVDGEGTLLTTRQCLLNPNRNPDLSEEELERFLRAAFGVERVLWLDEGLKNDHTDGHVDTIARFVKPGVVVAMEPRDAADPNRAVLKGLIGQLSRLRDARGRKLEVVTVPSPGGVLDAEGAVMPASFVNFYIANTTVVVPTYGTANDAEAVAAIAACFPGRRVIGASARALLSGGGAFHCITQQQPAGRSAVEERGAR